MAEHKIQFTCPSCGENGILSVDLPTTSTPDKPNVRSRISPIGNILVYRITSEEIKQFIIHKARKYVPDAKIEVVTCYSEKKNQKKNEPHRSYASLRVAFSENVVEQKDENGWFGKIGDNNNRVRVVKGLFENLIQMYKFDIKDIDKWLSSYKTLEELEELFGLTETDIKDMRAYANPRRVPTRGGEQWIIFQAAANKVIRDMLTDSKTNKQIGRIQIQDVRAISKDICEFIVYVHPEDMKLQENIHVRQLMLGEEKPKKK
ncbi:MAG: hypothetical protein NC548_12985 [Lachnospiraceae bacterium]|nr:hypothetical protein [Lachnospiraceae bacterium]MCM1230695.1 hypothetical protein [Ruminococcus flavefaciens]